MERDDLKSKLTSFAENHGYALSDQADKVIDGLLAREKKHGKTYCPCRVLKDEAYNETIICPCIHVHDEIDKHGKCHCNLFIALPGEARLLNPASTGDG